MSAPNHRDTFIFCRYFKEAIAELEDKDKLAIYEAISDYIFSGVEPDLKGGIKTIFKLIKPHLDSVLFENK